MNGPALVTKDELKRFRACGVGLFVIAAMLAYGVGRVCEAWRGAEWPVSRGALATLRASIDPPLDVFHGASYINYRAINMIPFPPLVEGEEEPTAEEVGKTVSDDADNQQDQH